MRPTPRKAAHIERRSAPSASTRSPGTAAAIASPQRRRAPHAPDERPDLAADNHLTDTDVDTIGARLRRWDAAAEAPWTHEYLALIAENEAVRAPDLAARLGMETPRFKRRVRQLKGLGLTISLDVGYRISPRGRAYLARRG